LSKFFFNIFIFLMFNFVFILLMNNFFFAIRFNFVNFLLFFSFNVLNFIFNVRGEIINNFNITILEISNSLHPIDHFLFTSETESFKGSFLRFLNINPGLNISFIVMGISGHNLKTVGSSPSLGFHIRSNL
jgi:hypothetical protein